MNTNLYWIETNQATKEGHCETADDLEHWKKLHPDNQELLKRCIERCSKPKNTKHTSFSAKQSCRRGCVNNARVELEIKQLFYSDGVLLQWISTDTDHCGTASELIEWKAAHFNCAEVKCASEIEDELDLTCVKSLSSQCEAACEKRGPGYVYVGKVVSTVPFCQELGLHAHPPLSNECHAV
jgi:hypothetical protein